jgi:hypothetical protein
MDHDENFDNNAVIMPDPVTLALWHSAIIA